MNQEPAASSRNEDLPVIDATIPATDHKNASGGKGSDRKTLGRTLVAESETVPPEVKWEAEHRSYHDKFWGILYLCAFLTFVISGSVLLTKAQPRYEWVSADVDTDSGITIHDGMTVRVVSSHFRDDVAQCCASKVDTANDDPWDLCSELTADTAIRRRLQVSDGDDGQSTTSSFRESKLEPGDGMFVSR